MVSQKRAFRQIHGDSSQGVIHRRYGMAESFNAFAVSKCLIKSIAQHKTHIFNRMVKINFQVAFRLYAQIKKAVNGEQNKHMIKKGYAGRYFRLAATI